MNNGTGMEVPIKNGKFPKQVPREITASGINLTAMQWMYCMEPWKTEIMW